MVKLTVTGGTVLYKGAIYRKNNSFEIDIDTELTPCLRMAIGCGQIMAAKQIAGVPTTPADVPKSRENVEADKKVQDDDETNGDLPTESTDEEIQVFKPGRGGKRGKK